MKKAPIGSGLDCYIAKALELGAQGAKVIDAASIVTAAWVRLKCQFGCDGYNEGLCCPPHTPKPEETQAVIDCYCRALLIRFPKLGRPSSVIVELERDIFLAGFYKAFGFGAGPCRLCRKCHLDACPHRDKARPSMEACGIDVYATARANGFPIEVVRDRSCAQNYYGLILID